MNTNNDLNTNLNKVIGVGMAKTGTSTLAICLEFLGFGPHQGFDAELSRQVKTGNIAESLKTAEPAGFLEDSPWLSLYKELDAAHSNSKFILTLRKSSEAHAISNWQHTLRKGQRFECEKEERIAITKQRYEAHNQAVRDYFANRPNDLLEVCWELGDGWDKICPFLGVEMPLIPFPHVNAKPKNVAAPIVKILNRKKIYIARMRWNQKLRLISNSRLP